MGLPTSRPACSRFPGQQQRQPYGRWPTRREPQSAELPRRRRHRACSLCFPRPALATFPTAALGALVIYAAIRLIDVAGSAGCRFRRSEFLLALATTAGCSSAFCTDVLVAVRLSIAGPAPPDRPSTRRHPRVRRPASPACTTSTTTPTRRGAGPGRLSLRLALFFANAEDFQHRALAAVDDGRTRSGGSSSTPRPTSRWTDSSRRPGGSTDHIGAAGHRPRPDASQVRGGHNLGPGRIPTAGGARARVHDLADRRGRLPGMAGTDCFGATGRAARVNRRTAPHPDRRQTGTTAAVGLQPLRAAQHDLSVHPVWGGQPTGALYCRPLMVRGSISMNTGRFPAAQGTRPSSSQSSIRSSD